MLPKVAVGVTPELQDTGAWRSKSLREEQAGSWQTAEPAALAAGTAAAPKPQCGPCKNGGHLVRGFFQGSSQLSHTQGAVGMAGIPQRGSGAEQLEHRDTKT